ncbi:aminotransferase class IV [Syntrophobacter fumaroxidans]|uniref:Aminotransferase, class IV n=1 Tax=Syntrophobacter fumaroxidans (strain DSM 10017 / MPOB) TaxID=335543 RepID=A0LN78_SYNFM|nr:aminotransferase class IV [Syntrophobacter fumaroxidans]ABK18880.1 aminotransferase, class IV [Syntrophobacter fumaroxidans MPOB]
MSIRRLSFDEVIDRLLLLKEPFHKDYLAMYSSWYGGIITDPALMMVPVDDHMVHRGDGIFEAFKCVNWKVYGLHRHLARLERSAKASMLDLPMSRIQLEEIVLCTIAAASEPDSLVKLLVSRGPGGLSANPYECPARQVYVIVSRLNLPPEEKYLEGVKLISSNVPIKQEYLANIKSCNYLPNALMKKESEDAGADFAVSIDDRGFLGEGPTENIGIITKKREFLVPRFHRVLRGTTITRVMELAQPMVASGELSDVREADITVEQAHEAAEIIMFGTTFDVLSVVDFDGRQVGEGKPGPIYRVFREILNRDIRECREMLTPVKE